ncbi:MAG: hypothetical protein M0R02_07865 [Bacteroidales bacterium]|nr:hypothetical protein [Bacteroidales bacterium]NLK80715.1 hypothetical protein [Bacteroidales bacterium]
MVTLIFFYSNGIILHIGGRYNYEELLNMEKEITNTQLIQKLKENKYCWGLFKIEDKNILFERYYNSDALSKKAYIRSGLIVNDTTFRITKSVRSDGIEEKEIEEIYHFKQFSPKPDSTNNFIK